MQHNLFHLPIGPRFKLETLFEDLKDTVEKQKPRERKSNSWISPETWIIVDHSMVLWWQRTLYHTSSRYLKQCIDVSLKADRERQTEHLAEAI